MDAAEQRVIRRAATVAASVMTVSLIVGVAWGTGGADGSGGHHGPNGPAATARSTGSMKPVGAFGRRLDADDRHRPRPLPKGSGRGGAEE